MGSFFRGNPTLLLLLLLFFNDRCCRWLDHTFWYLSINTAWDMKATDPIDASSTKRRWNPQRHPPALFELLTNSLKCFPCVNRNIHRFIAIICLVLHSPCWMISKIPSALCRVPRGALGSALLPTASHEPVGVKDNRALNQKQKTDHQSADSSEFS